MKSLTVPFLLLLSFVLLVAFLTVLFRPIYVPSVHPYSSVKAVKIYDEVQDEEHYLGEITLGQDIGEVTLGQIAEIWANANWKSTKPQAAAKMLVVAEDRLPIRLSYYGGFYTIDGVKGHFVIPFRSQKTMAAFLQYVRTEFKK